MGTNYYWYGEEPCECCGRPFEPLHIGKSSGGWCFTLHIIPEKGINDLPDWENLWRWNRSSSYIEDEYGRRIIPDEMKKIITNRHWDKEPDGSFDYKANYAEPGPNNLARHVVGKSCVKHGAGTWDCVLGEFS